MADIYMIISGKFNSRGVSPIVGTILLIFLIIVLVGSIGIYSLTIRSPDPAPVSRLNFEGVNDNDTIFHIYHGGGDPINNLEDSLDIYINGSLVNENITLDIRENKKFEAGEKLKVFLNNHQVTGKIRLVHKPSKSVIAESEAEINKKIGDSKTKLWNFNTENRLWETTDSEKSDATTTINDNSITLNSKDAILWWTLDSKTNNKAKDLTSNNLKGLTNDIKISAGIKTSIGS